MPQFGGGHFMAPLVTAFLLPLVVVTAAQVALLPSRTGDSMRPKSKARSV
jgi:hypothetical protein